MTRGRRRSRSSPDERLRSIEQLVRLQSIEQQQQHQQSLADRIRLQHQKSGRGGQGQKLYTPSNRAPSLRAPPVSSSSTSNQAESAVLVDDEGFREESPLSLRRPPVDQHATSLAAFEISTPSDCVAMRDHQHLSWLTDSVVRLLFRCVSCAVQSTQSTIRSCGTRFRCFETSVRCGDPTSRKENVSVDGVEALQ